MARQIDEIMKTVVSIEDKSKDSTTNWLQESLKKSAAANRRKGYNRFLCCFINSEVKEEVEVPESEDKTENEPSSKFRCYQKAKQKVVNSKVQDAIKCVSDLIYEIILDS